MEAGGDNLHLNNARNAEADQGGDVRPVHRPFGTLRGQNALENHGQVETGAHIGKQHDGGGEAHRRLALPFGERVRPETGLAGGRSERDLRVGGMAREAETRPERLQERGGNEGARHVQRGERAKPR